MKSTTSSKAAKAGSQSKHSASTELPSSDHVSTTEPESEELSPGYSMEEMRASLGDGPLRFAPNHSGRTVTTESTTTTASDTASCFSGSQIQTSLTSSTLSPSGREKKCCEHLKRQWEASTPDVPFSYDMYLRLQNEKQAVAQSRGAPAPEYTPFALSIEELEPQLLTETLFPLPGLRSTAGFEMFYMRPARYFPKRQPTEDIIDNLAYVMQSMAESERACRKGIGFLANMDGWRYEHFSVRYCNEFMAMLQQRGPATVKLFLIVNPPSWFPSIWRIMKGMLSREFRKKVFMIREAALDEFLEPGFEEFLPDDLTRGKTNTHELVNDFIAYRKFVEDAIGIDI